MFFPSNIKHETHNQICSRSSAPLFSFCKSNSLHVWMFPQRQRAVRSAFMAQWPAFSRRCGVFTIILFALYFLEVCYASALESSHSTNAGGTVEQAVLDELYDWLEKRGVKYVRDGTWNSKVVFNARMHVVLWEFEHMAETDIYSEAILMRGPDSNISVHINTSRGDTPH